VRKVLLVAALVALAVPVAADAARAPISAVATQTSRKAVGKQNIFTETLTVKNKVIAHDRITCTLLNTTTENCGAVFTFVNGKGTITVTGKLSASSPLAIMTIVGATGSFKGAVGQMDLHLLSGTKALARFNFA
jgi:hypothetical protein